MRTVLTHFRNTKVNDLNNNAFDDLYEEISRDWQTKAQELQERRWRKLREESIR